MTWATESTADFRAEYRKHCARNAAMRQKVDRKIAQVAANPIHYKPLRAPLQGVRRVHVGGSYVILFEPDVRRKTVRFLRLVHHDEAYGY